MDRARWASPTTAGAESTVGAHLYEYKRPTAVRQAHWQEDCPSAIGDRYSAADLVPCGEPPIETPSGSGRPAVE